MNKSQIVVALFCFAAVSVSHAAEFDDTGRVLKVVEQTEQVNQPQRECRTEYVQVQQRPERQERSVGGALLGGLAGGLLGNQVGGGNGRTAATAGGAVIGALVGDRMQNNNDGGAVTTSEQPVQRCRMVDRWETRVNGYAVTYEYRGREYTSVMPRDPGDRIRLHVSVTPRP